MLSLSSYEYELPEALIAQRPCSLRDSSRLMVLNRATEQISEMVFHQLADWLHENDSLVLNDTKVFPARLIGKKITGGVVEIFLIKQVENGIWDVLAKPSRKLRIGTKVYFSDSFFCTILPSDDSELRKVQFSWEGEFDQALAKHGKIPLPPYIQRDSDSVDDDRYQTVFAANSGAVAAPTAGLHFTQDLLEKLSKKGVLQTHVTLHVGMGTFKPVITESIQQHEMHEERYRISETAARQLNSRSVRGTQICVGTTCCRTLEAASDGGGIIRPGSGTTDIFIFPGYKFKYVKTLLTNFHLPGSTLLMLVCAFGGYEFVMEAYKKAVRDRYRFFSYGDAMLIL